MTTGLLLVFNRIYGFRIGQEIFHLGEVIGMKGLDIRLAQDKWAWSTTATLAAGRSASRVEQLCDLWVFFP